jgi:hypothetical protein
MRSHQYWLPATILSAAVLLTVGVGAQTRGAQPARPAQPAGRGAQPAGDKPAAPPEWWFLGKQEEGDLLFLDSNGVQEWEKDEVYSFKGFYYYPVPRTMTNNTNGQKQVLEYEEYDAWINCSLKELSDVRHFFYQADGKQIVVEENEDMLMLEPEEVSAVEFAFVCDRERAGGAHKFERITGDPLSYARRR